MVTIYKNLIALNLESLNAKKLFLKKNRFFFGVYVFMTVINGKSIISSWIKWNRYYIYIPRGVTNSSTSQD